MSLDNSKVRILNQIAVHFGEVVQKALAADDVSDILLNEDGAIWVERFGQPMRKEGELSETSALLAINAIAGYFRMVCRENSPIISCELPGSGDRFEANIPPIVAAPTFAIRKKASRVFTLDEYIATGVMTDKQAAQIRKAVAEGKNILVAGSTGSGKTTLTNAIIAEIVEQFPDQRMFIIEDTREIQCSAKNRILARSSPDISIIEILRSAMRQRPDKIFIGEVRDGTAWDLLKAWGSGHGGGACTIHADADPSRTKNYKAALRRMEHLCSEKSECPTQTEVLRDIIAGTIGIIIYIGRSHLDNTRKVDSIVEVKGYNGSDYLLAVV